MLLFWLPVASATTPPTPVPVYDVPGLLVALGDASAGDVIELATGTYHGQFVVPAGVTLRGTTDVELQNESGVVLDLLGDTIVAQPTVIENLSVNGLIYWSSGNADYYGGRGIRTAHDLVLRDARVYGCAVSDAGASVQVLGTPTVRIEDSALEGGYSRGRGGQVYLEQGASLEIVDSTLVDGSAATEGGGIHATGATVTIQGSTLANNGSGRTGAGLYLRDADTTVTGTVISGSTVSGTYPGGGLYVEGGILTMSDSSVAESQAFRGGGAWLGGGALVSFVDTEISGNRALYRGGGLYVEPLAGLTVTDSRVADNHAAQGGGLYTAACCTVPMVLHRVAVCSNYLDDDADPLLPSTGGGAVFEDSAVVVTNGVWVDNLASLPTDGEAAALHVTGASSVDLHNDAFAFGQADARWSAVAVDGTAVVDLRNSLVIENHVGPTAVHLDASAYAALTVAYDAFWENLPLDVDPPELLDGTSLVGIDPGLLPLTRADCTLEAWIPEEGSPLIDAGDPGIPDPDGSTSDIGPWGGPGAILLEPLDADADGVPDDEDCAPDDASVYPGATEVCNGIDDDCDALVDAEDPDCEGLVNVAPDLDGDGWAAEDAVLAPACPEASGQSEILGDCDDADPDTNPGAEEDEDPEVDRDCDGVGDLDGKLERDDCGCGQAPGAPVVALPLLLLIARRRTRGAGRRRA